MTPAAKPRSSKPITPFRLTLTDEEMLASCARYQYMTAEQWCRLFEDPGKLRYIQQRSRKLADEDYLIRLYISRAAREGKAPSIFTLGLKGRRHVESLGKTVPKRFRPQDVKSLSPQHLAHSEDITDVLLSVDLLARHDERIIIREMLHERFLKEQDYRIPVKVADLRTGQLPEKGVDVIPDAFVRVSAQAASGARGFPIVIEVDRDTEEQLAFCQKIARLYVFGTSEAFERVYGARSLNVAFVVLPPKRDPVVRLAEIMEWTERELTQRKLRHEAPSFSFCPLDPATTDPRDFWLDAKWLHPFSQTPHALIDLAEDPEGGL